MFTINLNSLEKIQSLLLCKVNKTIIGEISTDYLSESNISLVNISEISLEIPKFITDKKTKKKIKYHLYDEFKNKRYIYVDEKDYYMIDKIKENKNKTCKTVTAYRGEYKLSKKNIVLEDSDIRLKTSDLDKDIYSINDLLLEQTGWHFSYIQDEILYDNDKEERLRLATSVDTDWYDFLTNKLSELFGYIPFFDTVNKAIQLIKIDNFGENIKICLSNDNYIKDLATTEDSKDLITRLTLINDNLDIAGNLSTGYNHINNFSYFIDIKEMSDELIKALATYEDIVEKRNIEWKLLRTEKIEKQNQLSTKNNEWLILNSQINTLKKIINELELNGNKTDIIPKKEELQEKIDKETTYRIQIKELEEQIELITQNIEHINLLCKYETCTDNEGNLVFTKELLDEMKEFVFEDTFKNEDYIKEEEMIKAGKEKLELICKPTITYDIDVINFIDRIIDDNFRIHWNGELSLGDIVILLNDDGNETFVYFVGYKYDYTSNKLNVTLSNKKQYKSGVRHINESIKLSKKLNKIISQNSYIFNDVKNLRLNMSKRIIK